MPSAKALAAAKANEEDEANPLSGASVKILQETASDIVEKVSSVSTLFDEEKDDLFSKFDLNELELGRVLGRGGFCVVNEIRGMNLDDSIIEGAKPEMREYQTREAMSNRCMRGGEARYAIKMLSDDCRKNPALFLKGTIDLAIETRFLAVMNHPHLIKMRAVANASAFDDGYFIVLDRLYDTLETRVRKWKSALKKTKGVRGALGGGKKKAQEVILEKIGSAHDVSCAMVYMHSLNIIYRDLKPENLGFDVRGEIKVFDFGLAKELKESDKVGDDTFKLTGFTGSLRYMAPEVAKSLPYNLSADVYSFSMLLWYILEMETPFDTYSCKMHEDRVVNKGYRPVCDKSWPSEWTDLIKKSWSHVPSKRPSFETIKEILYEEVLKFSEDESEGDDIDISQRSFRNVTL